MEAYVERILAGSTTHYGRHAAAAADAHVALLVVVAMAAVEYAAARDIFHYPNLSKANDQPASQ